MPSFTVPPLGFALVALALAGCGSGATVPTGPRDATVDMAPALDAFADSSDVDTDGSAAVCTASAGPFSPVSTRCGQFVDASGRVVVLTGINARVNGVFDVTLSGGRTPLETIPTFAMADATRMRQLGYNLLRLPIQWSGVEPTATGGFDETYLDQVQSAVALAAGAGMLVLLDFHQDAYSKEIGEDGAPLWAIDPPPTMLLQGPLTDLGTRRASTQVLDAFATFFGSSSDGDTLRMRFAAMAAHVAARFASVPGVMGYELYNEPEATDSQLAQLYQLAGTAIRAADPARLLVFEPDVIYRDLFNQSTVPTAPFPFAGGAYAPHTYPLVFTGSMADLESFTQQSLAPATTSARDEATAWGTPLLITEWGDGPTGVRATEYIQDMAANQESVMASSAFWLWKEESQGAWGLFDLNTTTGVWTERTAMRQALARVRPQAIAGWPDHWSYDPGTFHFELGYLGDPTVTTPTLLYIPEAEDFAPIYTVTCDGTPVTVTRDAATGIITVPCNGPGEHTVAVVAALP